MQYLLTLFSMAVILAGCQSNPAPFNGTYGFETAALGKDATVISLVGRTDESFDDLKAQLIQLCRATYPHLGGNISIKILDQKERMQRVDVSFPAGYSGFGGPDANRLPLPSMPPLTTTRSERRTLALCEAAANG